jgi:uncharacterized protein
MAHSPNKIPSKILAKIFSMSTANTLKFLLIGLVRGYRVVISPLLMPCCRFYPTCSQYAIDALNTHGALRAVWLTTKRIARCHPGHPGGYDPVPANPKNLS